MLARSRSLVLAIALALGSATAACSYIPELPTPDVPDAPVDRGPPPRRTVAELFAHGDQEFGDVEIHDLAGAYGLKIQIDLIGGRRLLTNAKNDVVVEPSARAVTINKVSYPLENEIHWKDGKLYLPGDARAVFAEHIRSVDVPDVPDKFAYLDKDEAPKPGPAPLAPAQPLAIVGAPTLPASWNVAANRTWSYIVIHHSATHEGSAKSFDRFHRSKHWTHGLGYHFVIGNGSETQDGAIEIGPRWANQNSGVAGAHAGDDFYNKHGIGICLVGDFDREMPTPKQIAGLHTLVHVLMARYAIPASHVIGHKQVRVGHTECPGHHFPLEAFVRGL